MKLNDSKLCPYCVTEEQTINHLFVECKLACDFWEKFESWWKEKTKKRIQLSAVHILYGILEPSENSQLVNYLLLTAKLSDIIYFQHTFKTKASVSEGSCEKWTSNKKMNSK